MKLKQKNNLGFTLIELTVVVSIIGLMASVLLVSVAQSRMKARDARKIADFKQISTAIALFYQANGRMPKNNNCYDFGSNTSSVCASNQTGNSGECDAPVLGVPGGTTNNLAPASFRATMQELVDAGILSRVPVSPPGGPGYCYYDFGRNNTGAILMTNLESGNPTVNGIPPSCRPWTSSGATWCEQISSMQYCMCNGY